MAEREVPEAMRLLVVEDQKLLLQSLQRGLIAEGYFVSGASTGAEGYRLASTEQPDAMVLDLLLPDGDGIQTLQRLRAEGFNKPVLILTARDSIEDRIRGLDSGADDYLVKPFAFGELVARLKALLRRVVTTSETVLHVKELVIDVLSRRVQRAGRDIELTPRQYEMLEYFARHQGQVVTRQMLAADVWRAATATWTNVIEVQVTQLRKKIEMAGCEQLLHTVRGEGYLLGDKPC